MNYSERIDKLFGVTNYSHRTLRTLLDPFSSEWNDTTMEKKKEILKKIVDSGEDLWLIVVEYQAYYRDINKQDVAKDAQSGLAYMLQYILQQTPRKE